MADELNESELANTCRMRNSRSRNFYAAKSAVVGSIRAISADGEAGLVTVCALQRRPRHAGWSLHP
jgi:hypothetical protein